ncbi:Peptidase S10, serine carboxypeptidase, partial [Cynara cardunculus var. scolymus]
CRYVTIDENHGKKLYYYYVLSERNPSQDPVVLWLNGGPGCSSFDGFVYEHGPFNFEKTGSLPKLHLNPYTWTKVSNIIYLDSPAGVGMSYSGNKSDYITMDTKTALDSHKFLLEWFKLYPEYLSNPFFIAGESYAGVYVPMLSYEVMKERSRNPVFDNPLGLDAGDKPTLNFKEVTKECQGTYYSPANDDCESNLAKVDQIRLGNTNLPLSFRKLGETERPLPVRTRMFGRAWPFRAPVKAGYVPTWPELLNSAENVPCTDDEVATVWLNNEAVRSALHADPISVAGNWELCTDKIRYYHDAGSMIKYHQNLTARGYRALIYSGDHDMCVPFTGSEAWTRSLGYAVTDEWRNWQVDGQVSGFVQGYDNGLTFLTVKGSGHTVPEYKPKEALAFYTRWLEGMKI